MSERRKSALKIKNLIAKTTLKLDRKIIRELDRISDLPDSILTHILGKLPTKYAVGTAILSTRWKHLFAQIPNLEISINDSDLLEPDRHLDFDFVFHRRKVNFIKFMFRLFDVILKEVRVIKKFHLEVDIDYEYNETMFNEGICFHFEQISKWVSAALKLNVSYLWVFCPISYGATPESLLHSTSLLDVMLNWHAGICVPDTVCLPNLKCLYLKNVLFHGNDLQKVLSGCNVLEELCLCRCEFSDTKEAVHIFSPSVKSFKWSHCYKDEKYGLELDMPELLFLCYDDHIPEYFLVKDLNSLCKAFINSGPTLEQYEGLGQEDFELCLKKLTDLVLGCSNVEFLSLPNISVAAISCTFPLLCPFHNLIELELHYLGMNGWKLLPYLLKNAPNLEVLVLTEGFSEYKGGFKIFICHMLEYSRQLPYWLALNLQRIRFENFHGEIDETDLLKYFLTHAKVLRKIEISFARLCPKKLSKAATEVLALQKLSCKCDIELTFEEEEKDGHRSFGMREFE